MQPFLSLAVVLIALSLQADVRVAGAAEPASPAAPPSFAAFLASVRAAPAAPEAAGDARQAAVPDEMRTYLLRRYERLEAREVRHSFSDDNDAVFDCIPTMRQPSLQGAAAVPPTAPDLPKPANTRAAAASPPPLAAPLTPDRFDAFGKSRYCTPGTIPFQRITLDALRRFGTMQQFFRKSPDGASVPRSDIVAPEVAATHRYAHAYQVVNNLGGHSFLNVWRPRVTPDQIFSLSQQWYIGGSGSGLQTAEVGWQVYPQFYGNQKPVFFIYWTADGYSSTGCYNLTCPGFVQTSNAWAIGGAINSWSVQDGNQVEIEVSWRLQQGRWWLYVNGTDSAHAIGYLPVSVYRGGALATGATLIDYGGETVGTTSWPQMGSGRFAYVGYGKAAYQRTIYYYPPAGGIAYARLTRDQGWPQQYTVRVQNTAPWMQSIYFGGIGGTD